MTKERQTEGPRSQWASSREGFEGRRVCLGLPLLSRWRPCLDPEPGSSTPDILGRPLPRGFLRSEDALWKENASSASSCGPLCRRGCGATRRVRRRLAAPGGGPSRKAVRRRRVTVAESSDSPLDVFGQRCTQSLLRNGEVLPPRCTASPGSPGPLSPPPVPAPPLLGSARRTVGRSGGTLLFRV